ncbi:MAG: oligosaccharide flippase family protein [candidate division Zixibacteria bacterium]|nr:oligosaccharide flippase family protein [candidate division Zixibacteria bacterium]
MANPKRRLVKNIFSNWASMFVSLGLAFFMSPFLVHNLGKEQYGIWALVLSVVAYTNFLDAGMKQSLARFIPKYYATKDYKSLNEIINSSNLIYGISGTLIIPFVLIIAIYFIDLFNVSPELKTAMQIVLIIIGFKQVCVFYFMTSTALGPFHRYDIGNVIDIIVALLNALIIVYFVSTGRGLIALAVITFSTHFAKLIARTIAQKRLVPEIKYRLKNANIKRVKELMSYGFISLLIVVAWMVIFSSDNIIIGIFLNTTQVTYFSIAGIMINYLRTMINAIGIPLIPAISHFDASKDHKEIADLYLRLSKYLYYLTSCVAAGILFLGGRFILLWMGDDFQSTVNVLHILIIPAAIYLPQVAANSVLLGISKHKTLLYILVIEAVLKIALSVILVQTSLGIYGVALGTAMPQFIIYLFIYPVVFSRIIEISLKSFYTTNLKMVLAASVLTVPIGFLLTNFNPIGGWPGLIINTMGLSLVALAGFWYWVLIPEDRVNLLARFKR